MTLNNKSFFGRDIQSSCLEGHYEEIWKYINDNENIYITPKGDHVTIRYIEQLI